MLSGILAIVVGVSVHGSAQTVRPEPGKFAAPYYGQFSELPVGAVKPRGWLRQWLERQADGLSGHPENMSYPYDTCLYAGNIPPPASKSKWWSPWWPYEQAGYFVDGTTRLSWLVDDPVVDLRRDANLRNILAHSENGSLGPSHWGWPDAVVGRALMAQFSATGDARVAKVLADELIANADEITRPRDSKEMFYLYRGGANFEEAFYLYGLTGDRRLLELGRKVYENYLTNTNSFLSAARIRSDVPFHEHGVTAAETMKCLPLTYLYTGDTEALDYARAAYQKVVDNSLMPDGGMVSSEYLETNAFNSLHETCDITDWSWSLGYLLMATGDPRWADLIERTTFNALPGAVTKDFKQLQYFSGVNQVLIAATNKSVPHCVTRMTYRPAHDTECCAGNVNRAMPNYTIRMWMRSQDGGLATVFYGPSQVNTTVHGHEVSLIEDTDYPFRDRISFRVQTAEPVSFDLQFRIPSWCDAAKIRVNGTMLSGPLQAGTFAPVRREFRDGDTIELTLPMRVRVEDWLHGQSVCLARGPLVYSLKIGEQRVEHTNDPPAIAALLRGHPIQGFPEVEFYPLTDWRYGIDAAMRNDTSKIRVVESSMTDNPFSPDHAPVRLELPLRPLPDWCPRWTSALRDWSDTGVEWPEPPSSLPTDSERASAKAAVMCVMTPYGATHLRLTTLPLIGPP